MATLLIPLATGDNYHRPSQEVFLGLVVCVEDMMVVFTVRSTSLKGMTESLPLLFLCLFFRNEFVLQCLVEMRSG